MLEKVQWLGAGLFWRGREVREGVDYCLTRFLLIKGMDGLWCLWAWDNNGLGWLILGVVWFGFGSCK